MDRRVVVGQLRIPNAGRSERASCLVGVGFELSAHLGFRTSPSRSRNWQSGGGPGAVKAPHPAAQGVAVGKPRTLASSGSVVSPPRTSAWAVSARAGWAARPSRSRAATRWRRESFRRNHSTRGRRPRYPVLRHAGQPLPEHSAQRRRSSRWFRTNSREEATAE